MEAPVCLIENRPNGLHVSPEALQLLSDIRNPVVVVSIVGLFRTGKSYLMNKLAGKNSGFLLGSTVEAKTKGIWMWCVPHPDRPNQTLVLLDTEGLGDPEKGSPENDTWIFSLAVLLSSTLVYNSVGTIEQTGLDKLHFVTELSEHIKAKSSSTPGDTDDTSEFVGFFPKFVWTVRDFTLQLQCDGKSITEDEYLENALKLKKGDSKKEQAYNLPRKCIRLFFPTRKCFTFYCPTVPENLCNVEQMSDDQLHKGFVEQAKKFCRYIYETSQEKTLPGGHIVTGNLLAKLAKAYVDTISSGNVPCLENEVLALAKIENRAAVDEAVAHYAQLMEQSVELPTETLQELLDIHKKCEEQSLKKFMARAFKDDTRQFQAEFMKTVDSKKEEYCRKNERESSDICSALLSSLSENLEQNIKNGSYLRSGGHQEFVNDLRKVEKEFLETPKKGIMAGKILKEFLQSKENISKTILQSDTSLQEKEKEIEALLNFRVLCSQAMIEEEEDEESECQLGAWPKKLASERVTQPDWTLWGKAMGATPFQEMVAGAVLSEPEMSPLIPTPEWRIPGQMYYEHFPLPPWSQRPVGLLEQFGQLNVSSLAQPLGTEQPRWTLAQPTFTFLGQEAAVPLTRMSTSFHSAQSGLIPSRTHWARPAGMTVPMGLGMTQQQSLLNQPTQVLQGPQQGLWGPSTPPQ